MTDFKTRKKDKQVFPTEETELSRKKDDYENVHINGHAKFDEHGHLISPGIKPKKKENNEGGKGSKKPDHPVRSFKGIKFELLESGYKTKEDAQKDADLLRGETGRKFRVKNIYGTWEVWGEQGTIFNYKTNKNIEGEQIANKSINESKKNLKTYEVTLEDKTGKNRFSDEYGFGTNPPIVIQANNEKELKRELEPKLKKDNVRIVSIEKEKFKAVRTITNR